MYYSVLYLYVQYIYIYINVSAKDFLKPETLPDSFRLGNYNGDWHTIDTHCLLEETASDTQHRVPHVCVDIKAAQKEGHLIKIELILEFPGGPVVRTLHVHCWGQSLSPGWGTKILKAMWLKRKKKGGGRAAGGGGGSGEKEPIFLSCSQIGETTKRKSF